MKRLSATLLTLCIISLALLFLASPPAFSAEEGQTELQALREKNDALAKEIESLRRQLEELKEEKLATATVFVKSVPTTSSPKTAEAVRDARNARTGVLISTRTATMTGDVPSPAYASVFSRGDEVGIAPATNVPLVGTVYSIVRNGIEAREWQLEDATLSQGDAGLETMLRFEKAKIFRKAKMLDKAAEELKKIIDQNVSDVTTHAARLTLIEILIEQKNNREAIAEFEKILSTAKDARSKRDALYGIINLSDDDPEAKTRTIDNLLEKLKENPIEKEEKPSKF